MNVLMSICRFEDDMEAVDLLARASTGQQGERTDLKQNVVDNINEVKSNGRPTGTSVAATMRRLSKDYPAIHARVLTGELTPNQAALEAGFRQPKFQLPADPEAAGRYLAEHVDDEWLTACYNAYREAKW